MSVSLADLPATSSAETWATARGPNQDKEDFDQNDATFDLDWAC